jgi:hypothetical protein
MGTVSEARCFAAHGFIMAHGSFMEHGFIMEQGFAAQGFFMEHGFIAAHGFAPGCLSKASAPPEAASVSTIDNVSDRARSILLLVKRISSPSFFCVYCSKIFFL